jgi:hypothetical protein
MLALSYTTSNDCMQQHRNEPMNDRSQVIFPRLFSQENEQDKPKPALAHITNDVKENQKLNPKQAAVQKATLAQAKHLWVDTAQSVRILAAKPTLPAAIHEEPKAANPALTANMQAQAKGLRELAPRDLCFDSSLAIEHPKDTKRLMDIFASKLEDTAYDEKLLAEMSNSAGAGAAARGYQPWAMPAWDSLPRSERRKFNHNDTFLMICYALLRQAQGFDSATKRAAQSAATRKENDEALDAAELSCFADGVRMDQPLVESIYAKRSPPLAWTVNDSAVISDCLLANLAWEDISTHNYFATADMLAANAGVTDRQMLNFCKTNENSFIAIVWPNAQGFDNEIVDLFHEHGTVYGQKNVILSGTEIANVVRMAHRDVFMHKKQVLDIFEMDDYVAQHVRNYMPFAQNAQKCTRVFVVTFKDVDTQRKCKQHIRNLFNMGYLSIHINDTHDETVELAEYFFGADSAKLS